MPENRVGRLSLTLILLFALMLGLTACSLDRKAVSPSWLVLLTTRELDESGLLDALLPPFEAQSGLRVKRVSVSTAKALEYASLAGVDVVLLPAGTALDRLAGPAPTLPPFQFEPLPTPTALSGTAGPEPPPQPLGILYNERQLAFWSELVLVGPPSDPLFLRERGRTLANCLKAIALSNTRFYGPMPQYEPGLRDVEQRFWGLSGRNTVQERGTGYRQIEGDLLAILKKAAQDGAYTLTPLPAFLQSQKAEGSDGTKGRLAINFSNDAALFLPYEIALPNNTATQDRDVKAARSFTLYLTNQKAQSIIAKFTQPEYSGPLYRPNYFSVYVPPLPVGQ